MSEEIILTLKDTYVQTTINKDGLQERKDILYDNLVNIFSKNEQISETDWLPGEYGLQRMAVKNNNSFYLYLEPPRKINIKYEHYTKPIFRKNFYTPEEWGISREQDETEDSFIERLKEVFNRKVEEDIGENGGYIHRFKMVTPRLLWSIPLRKQDGKYVGTNNVTLYTMKSSILTGEEKLYKAPFSNVYGSQSICWGSSSPELPSIKAIQGLSTLFFNAPFNSDLEGGRIRPFIGVNSRGDTMETNSFYSLAGKTTSMLESGVPDHEVLKFVEDHLMPYSLTPKSLFHIGLNNI